MKSAILPDPEPKWMRGTRITLGFFAALCVIYPTVIVLIQFDDYYMFPNGAILDRVFDLEKWSRIDLLRSWDGELLVRDVYDVCFDRKAIEGTTVRSGSFVWLGGDAPLTPEDDKAYKDVMRESGLIGDDGRCLGYFGSDLGAELLLRYPEVDWQRAKPDQKPLVQVPGEEPRSPAMLQTLGAMILRGLRWFGLGLVGPVWASIDTKRSIRSVNHISSKTGIPNPHRP